MQEIPEINCELREIDRQTAQKFLIDYHPQNYTNDTIRLGLFYNNVLVEVMTFGKPRYNKKFDWEILRVCAKPGKVYENLGFKLLKTASPTRHWYNPKVKQHFTDAFLWKKGFDRLFGTDYGKQTSNTKLMLEHGFVEIYDCGQATYVWKKEND